MKTIEELNSFMEGKNWKQGGSIVGQQHVFR